MANKFYYGNGFNSENSIAIIWDIEDVRRQLECLNENHGIDLKLSDDDCMEVLQRIVDNHDANYGVNWDSLYNAIEYCFEDEIKELCKKDKEIIPGIGIDYYWGDELNDKTKE